MTKEMDSIDDISECGSDCLHCVLGAAIQEFARTHDGNIREDDVFMVGQLMCDMVAAVDNDKAMVELVKRVRGVVGRMLDDVITGNWDGDKDEDSVGDVQGSA